MNYLKALFITILMIGLNSINAEQSSNLPDFEFVTIKSDSFKMGSPFWERHRDRDEKRARVTISKSFEMMTTEVTQLQWFTIMRDNPSSFKEKQYCEDDFKVIPTDNGDISLCPNHPVERVSWDRVQEFISKLNNQENLTGCDGTPESSTGCYRLPTEAEWELAARARSRTAYYFGNNPKDLTDHAWYWDNSNKQTHAVGLKEANSNGLYDVHGNVWEWVQDKYTSKLPGGTDPLHTNSESYRVIRGGSWLSFAENLRSANRSNGNPGHGYYDVGFRLLRTL